jgi:hypothetical protein
MGLRHHSVLQRDKIAAAPRLLVRAYEMLDDTAASICARPAHNCKPAGTEEDQARKMQPVNALIRVVVP